MGQKDVDAIKAVINDAYVEGVHQRQDLEAVRAGFDPEFRMMVLKDGAVAPVMVDQWMDRVEQLKKDDPAAWSNPTSVEYLLIDVTGRSAVAKLNVFKGTDFFSTDYMFLYRLDSGWKIVSKVFVTEPVPG